MVPNSETAERNFRIDLIRDAYGRNTRRAARALDALWRLYQCRLPLAEVGAGWPLRRK